MSTYIVEVDDSPEEDELEFAIIEDIEKEYGIKIEHLDLDLNDE